MLNVSVLKKIRESFTSKDIPLLNSLINKMYREKPYVGLHIIYNAHITLSSILQVEALVASGAKVTITSADHLRRDPEAINILKEAGIEFTPYDLLENEVCDVMLDCCAGLLHKAHPKYGAIELTQTGVIKFRDAEIDYPVISIDDAEIKKIETCFGTGDGFARGLRELSHTGLQHKKYMIFGYGKVGKGVVGALSKLTDKIIIVEHEKDKLEEASHTGFTSYLIDEKKCILKELADTDCIVTATGIKNMMSEFFDRSEIPVKYLVNMGSEDEYGEKFLEHEVLNQKLAINFCLEYPTRVLFLDPIFYAQNVAIDSLLNKKMSAGVFSLPKEIDLDILSQWTLNHYHLNIEGDYFQNILKHIPSFIYWKDRNHVYQGCNEQFAKVAGFSTPEEVIGKTDYELVWGKTEAELYQKGDTEAFNGKKLVNVEETQLQADGRQAIVLANKVPYFDDEGHIIGVLGIYTDITDRKKMEEDLRQAKIAAEIANQVKTAFISNMSHDIRSPLTGILNAAFALEENAQDDFAKAQAHKLINSSQQLSNLLTDILDVIKSDRFSETNIQSETFDIREFIQKLCEIYLLNAEQKTLKLKINVAETVPKYIVTDRAKLYRILFNLIGNAIKFTNKGSVEIKIAQQGFFQDKVILEFSVKDTGIGISDEFKNKVFDLFSRETHANKGVYSGYGLGLHMAQNYMHVLNSEINFTSTKGHGSTFYFDLLVEEGKKENVRKTTEATYASISNIPTQGIAPTHIPTKEKTSEKKLSTSQPIVLLIEDDKLIMDDNERILKKAGFIIIRAEDGETALKKAKTETFDIIMTDLGLPGLSGDEFVALYRCWEKTSGKTLVPIVAYTGNANDPKVEKICFAAGVNAILPKPVAPTVLADTLHSLLNHVEQKIPPKNPTSTITITDPTKALGFELPETEAELFQLEEYAMFEPSLAMSYQDDLQGLAKVLKTRINLTLENVLELKAAHDQNNWEKIRATAHRLKGSAMILGLVKMQYACRYMERYYAAGLHDPVLLEKLYQQLLQVLIDTENYITKFLAENKQL